MNVRRRCFSFGTGAAAGVLALLALTTAAEANKCDRHPELCGLPTPADMACISKSPNLIEQIAPDESVDRTWQVCVENVGGSTANNVVVSDTLPEGVDSLGPDFADCPEGVASSIGPDGIISVSCNVGDVPAGESRCVDFNVRIFSETPDGTNVAEVGADNDANADNNGGDQCTATVSVGAPLPIVACIFKGAFPEAVEEGVTTEVRYEIVVQNQGIAASSDNQFAVEDDIPTDSAFVEAFDSFGDPCDFDGVGRVTCLLPGLDAGASDSGTEIRVSVASPTESSEVLNVARVIVPASGLPTAGPDCNKVLTVVPADGFEGCTPGFWRQDQHLALWPADLADDLWTALFAATGDAAIDAATLFEVVGLEGGGLIALARHGAAGLADSESAAVNYGLTTAEIVSLVNNAFVSGDANVIEAAKTMLDDLNNQGCPLP